MNAENSKVYSLWFVEEKIEGSDGELLIGIYSTEEKAKDAIQRLKDKPGFRGNVEGFQIHTYQVDRDHWTEGYVVK